MSVSKVLRCKSGWPRSSRSA